VNKLKLKSIKQYAKIMTRSEFDQFTEDDELCPSHIKLKDFGNDCNHLCDVCWNDALTGIEFKAAELTLPNESLLILNQLGELEVQAKTIKDQQEQLKLDLLDAMETHGIKKWDNDIMTITYVAATTSSRIDSAKLKKEKPELFETYSKTSDIKSSIRIKLKGDK